MDRAISLVLKEFSDENISIDVHENSVEIVTDSNSIVINNRVRGPKNGSYRSRMTHSEKLLSVNDKVELRPTFSSILIRGDLSVVPHDASKDLYREPDNNFIVKQREPGLVEVIGKLDKELKIVPLTVEESLTAQNMGLLISTN